METLQFFDRNIPCLAACPACNCEAVCPCRRHGDRQGGRSTYETCDFVLSWMLEKGHVDGRDLSGLSTVLVGSYADDESGSPWRVALFIDETADEDRQRDLADVFLGRIGGDTHRLYGRLIQDVSMIRPAAIRLVHEPGAMAHRCLDLRRSPVDRRGEHPGSRELRDQRPPSRHRVDLRRAQCGHTSLRMETPRAMRVRVPVRV